VKKKKVQQTVPPPFWRGQPLLKAAFNPIQEPNLVRDEHGDIYQQDCCGPVPTKAKAAGGVDEGKFGEVDVVGRHGHLTGLLKKQSVILVVAILVFVLPVVATKLTTKEPAQFELKI